jgi:biopolymer transport protein ExbB/TolQ
MLVQTHGVDPLLEAMNDDRTAASPLFRRLQAATEQWRVSPDLAGVDTVLAQHAAYDEEHVHAGYSLIRTFVWALPVLGLIGTVIGISVAVGGFADFLGGDIDDVSVIKTNLVSVTSGLSYAFLITLIGLATSLILMLTTSALQVREESIYSFIQQSITDTFLPALQRVSPGAARTVPEDREAWREALSEIARTVIADVGRFGDEVLRGLARRQQDLFNQSAESLVDLRAKGVAAGEAVIRGAIDAGAILQNAADRIVAPFSALENALQHSREDLARQTAEQGTALAALRDGIRTTAARWQDISNGLSSTVARFEASVERAAESQVALSNALREIDLAALRSTIEQHDAVAVRHANALEATTHGIEGLAGLAQPAVSTQSELARALKGLQDSGVLSDLASLPESVRELTPVLRSFREPFVLQAVPVPLRAVTPGRDGDGA